MKNIPQWILEVVETDNLYCNKCRKTMRVKNLTSIGIQESSIAPHNDKLCIGLSCDDCKDMTIFELREMDLIEFAFELLEKETDAPKKKISKSKEKEKDILKDLSEDKPRKRRSVTKHSKITKKEISDVARFLKSVKTHEEFLVAMGLSPGQISEYNYKKDEHGD